MSNFVERVLLRSSDSRRVSQIKPAITPDALPETFALPAENFTPAPQDPSKNVQSAPMQAQQAEPVPEEIIKSEVKRSAFSSPIELPKVESERKAVASSNKQPNISHQTRSIDAEGSGVTKIEVNAQESPVHLGARQKNAEQNSSERKLAAGPMARAEPPPIQSKVLPQAKPVGTVEGAFSISQTKKQTFNAKQQTEREAHGSDPFVTVNIGRIEVRAIMPEKPLQKEAVPKLSLEEYLKRRREGTI